MPLGCVDGGFGQGHGQRASMPLACADGGIGHRKQFLLTYLLTDLLIYLFACLLACLLASDIHENLCDGSCASLTLPYSFLNSGKHLRYFRDCSYVPSVFITYTTEAFKFHL